MDTVIPIEVPKATWYKFAISLVREIYGDSMPVRMGLLKTFPRLMCTHVDSIINGSDEGGRHVQNEIESVIVDILQEHPNESSLGPTPESLSWDDYVDCTSTPKKQGDLALAIYRTLRLHDIAWDNYFGFYNTKSQMYLALTGKTPLTPASFRAVYPNVKPIVFSPEHEKRDKDLPQRRLDHIWSNTTCDVSGWTIRNLKEAIISTGLGKCGGVSSLPQVLNFKLITGNEKDTNMTLPGLTLPLFKKEHIYWDNIREAKFDGSILELGLAFWKSHNLRKGYYMAVYHALTKDDS